MTYKFMCKYTLEHVDLVPHEFISSGAVDISTCVCVVFVNGSCLEIKAETEVKSLCMFS